MPYLPSGWTFITLQFLVRCGYALVIPERANETVFVRDITIDQKARSTNIALAIAGGVVLLVLMIGILLLYLTQRSASARIPDVEPGTVPKPQWWMVEGKNEKMGWWKLGSGKDNSPEGELDNGSRIERLKAALQVRKAGKNGQQALSPVLPLQTDPDTQHKYPDVLERGFRAPVYPFQSSPQIPSITRTMYDGSNHLNPPLPAIVTEGQRVTLSRTGAPRSPAGRRRSRDRLSRQFRNPFLPLKDSDVTMPKISAPMPATIDPSNPKLQHVLSHSALSPQKVGVRRPAPLAPILFEPETPLASGPISRLGIPMSPRPQISPRMSPRPPNSPRLPNSPRPPVASPRF
jgi:hypothetical protein